MISYNSNKNELKITIPVESTAELYNYQKSLLGILGEIQIKGCNETLKDNLKSVYKLLSHLMPDAELLRQHEFLNNEFKTLLIGSVDGQVKGIVVKK